MGGLAKTVDYKGYKIDLGGHRFYSKSDKIMNWWMNILPIQGKYSYDDIQILKNNPNYNLNKNLSKDGPDPEKSNNVMLIRNRLSRILFFF